MEHTFQAFEDTLQMIDIDFAVINSQFSDKYTEILEAADWVEDEDAYMEANSSALGDALRSFIAAIVVTLEKLHDAIERQISEKLFSHQYKEKIKSLKEEIKASQALGRKTVALPNYPDMVVLYNKMVNDLSAKADRIANGRYITMNAMEKDVSSFNEALRKYDQQLEALMQQEREFPIGDVINFVENEANHKGLLKSLNAATKRFKVMESKVRQVETKEAILGRDLMSKHVVVVKRTSGSLVSMIRKWIARIIGKIVFYFA